MCVRYFVILMRGLINCIVPFMWHSVKEESNLLKKLDQWLPGLGVETMSKDGLEWCNYGFLFCGWMLIMAVIKNTSKSMVAFLQVNIISIKFIFKNREINHEIDTSFKDKCYIFVLFLLLNVKKHRHYGAMGTLCVYCP